MKIKSIKNKGRVLQQYVRNKLIEVFNLPEEDVKSIPGGVGGADIWLSKRAKISFPFAIECKNQERLGVWKAWEQAESNAGKINLNPMLVIKKNRQEPLVVLELDIFLDYFDDTKTEV